MKHKDKVMDPYLSHVFAEANAIGEEKNGWENDCRGLGWVCEEEKGVLLGGQGLERGYLLYGPPGTGKQI